MGNDVLSAGFFLMIMGSFYSFFRDLAVQYYYQIQSWFYVSVEVQEGDDCYKWLSGKDQRPTGTQSNTMLMDDTTKETLGD
jgi:hypothetical protein